MTATFSIGGDHNTFMGTITSSNKSMRMMISWLLFIAIGVLVNPFTTTFEGVNGARISRSPLLSKGEDLEIERQLKLLNKHPIMTYIESGDIIDCIDINKQPALDHPLLKNHKIQLKPSFSIESSTDEKIKPSMIRSTPDERCPEGTVPIRRTLKEDLIRAKSIQKRSYALANQFGDVKFPTNNLVGLHYSPDSSETLHGVSGRVSIYNVPVNTDQISQAHMGIETATDGIRVGWSINPQLFGDNVTRAFIQWTNDGYQNTGCYNTFCVGFVIVNRGVRPGAVLDPSTYGDINQKTVHFQVTQDQQTGNWWFIANDNDVKVGYWPKELFTSLGGSGTRVFWGGYVKAGADQTSPPMGSGHVLDDNPTHACFFSDIKYIDGSYSLVDPQADKVASTVECNLYGVSSYGYQKPYNFVFGGPGGKCT